MQDMDFLQAPRIQQLKDQIASADQENEKRKFLVLLVNEIVKAINESASARTEDVVEVGNFDEVTASLRNELARANKPLQTLLSELNLTVQEQSKIMKEIDEKSSEDFESQFQPAMIKRKREIVKVDNLHEIPVIEDVSVNNLSDLGQYFTELGNTIKDSLNVNVEAPQVNVPAPIINVPETKIDIPEVNLEPLISIIEDGLKKLRNNNKSNPLAVRLTDGAEWMKELVKIQKETSKAVAAFAGGNDQIRLLDSNRNFVNPASAEGQTYKLVPKAYDYISLSPASQPTTITYKTGGSGGVTVATLTIAYSGSDISSVTRT